jgi:hypothetical protein
MLIFGNLLINGFFFMAGLVLLEKGEGTLEAQVVTPLRTGEYLASKVITLTVLSLLESVLLVLLAVGLDINWLALLAGVALMTPLLALAGYLYWDNSTKQAAAERSEQAIIALDKLDAGNAAAALADLEPLTKDGSDGSQAAATMTRAAILVEQGKTEEAAKAFAAIAANSAVPQAYRDLATIREVSLRFDAMQPQQVVDRLKPLAGCVHVASL